MHDSLKTTSDTSQAGVLADMPRRQMIEATIGDASLSQMRFVTFKVNHFRSIASLFRWYQLLIYFGLHILGDILLGRDAPKRRAVWLRRAFERNGGSFVKLGIHLSMRIDFVPWAYCNELSCMTDRMKPFSIEQAVATVERSTGKPLAATFQSFDPEPIISTSVACTYQAILLSGEKVVVKVRRPGIGEQFMSDLEAFDWLLTLAEFLTIFRPGLTEVMRTEFRDLLIEELDFVQEARRQDSFRRAAANSRKRFFSAPRIHLDLTTAEVVINEFASGIWLWELLMAVEHGDQNVLARAEAMNINSDLVAKRLLWVNYWSWSENLFFHADPNPDEIIVGQDSTLYFINFTSTGTLTKSKRQALRQNLSYAWDRDPQNMARASLVLLEPLPPIDLIELIQELESYNWQLIYALEAAPHSVSWQERTSAVQWAGMMQLARKYSISVDIHVLRFIRATLLLESMAARLHGEIDYVDQFQKFDNYRAEQARRRVTESILDQMDGKNTEQSIIRMDRLAQTIQGLLFRTSHMLSLPSVNFNALMSKWSFAIYTLLRFITRTLLFTLGFAGVWALQLYVTQKPINLFELAQNVLINPIYQIVLIILIFIHGRIVLFRLDDKEVVQQ